VADSSRVDVSTFRGRIDIVAGEAGRIVVAGDTTVRVGWRPTLATALIPV
jgi:hypothetical protein